jgi:hypothetical protein
LVTFIAGTGVGLVTALGALDLRDKLRQDCLNSECRTEPGRSELSEAHSWATAANVSFAVAGAGAVLAIIGALTSGDGAAHGRDEPPSLSKAPTLSPWIGAGSCGVRGRF